MNVTSIIIPTFNENEQLRDCIYSIRRHTKTPHEIIVVDNGSTDGTLGFLLQESVSFISFPKTRGFTAACNAGLKIAMGSSLLLMNNDVLVSRNWLDNMLNCLYQSEDIGIVSPLDHLSSGKQQIEEPHSTLEDMAQMYNETNKGKSEEVQRLIGSCFLFRRKVMEEIGFLDARFNLGHDEDDDYCNRARLAGYRLMIAQDTFIGHYGNERMMFPVVHDEH
jgi:GT2 family glycosyltransferase